MSEPTAISALPKTPGDALVLQSSDLTANDLEVILEQQGYTITERILEQGTGTDCCVFVFKGKPDANDANYEDSAGPDVVEAEVDADSESDSEAASVFKGEGERKLGWRKITIGNPTGDNDPITFVPGTEDQKVSVEVVLAYAVDRDHPDDPDMVGLCLKVKQCQFGVVNSVNEPDHRGHFVYRIEVTALPTGWNTKVDHVIANPSSDDCVAISNQRTDTRGVGLSIGQSTAPLLLQYSGSNADGTTISGIPAHGWSSTRVDRSARSVLWTWGINYWCNGRQFSPDNLGKLLGSLPTSQHIPDLPFDDLKDVNLNKTNTEAEWVVPKSLLEGVEEIQWDISVKFYTALVMKKRWIAFRNRSIGVSWVRVCKEIPALVHRLTLKLDLQGSETTPGPVPFNRREASVP